jgi:putrescine---pyruvate transaminase
MNTEWGDSEWISLVRWKNFPHPTTSIQQQQDMSPSFIFKEGRGIYLKDIKGNTRLAELAPGDLQATFFTSGGSDANDTVYKLARYWILKGKPGRKK